MSVPTWAKCFENASGETKKDIPFTSQTKGGRT